MTTDPRISEVNFLRRRRRQAGQFQTDSRCILVRHRFVLEVTMTALHVAWSSLVEGDEQLDWPNSHTTMELCNVCVA